MEADLAFHTAVVEATHNTVLIDLFHDFTAASRASIAAAGDHVPHTDIPHQPIAAAIRSGDAEAAAQMTSACFETVLRSVTG